MARSTITLPNELLDELVSAIGAKSKTAAVVIAIKDEIKKRKVDSIRAAAGKMEFDMDADELRHGDERLS
jgi:Arc/MetJ family transcription regulator